MSNTKYPAIIFFTVVVVALVLPAFYYSQLPESIASHFNFKNEPDAWMSKQSFLLIHIGLIFFLAFLFAGTAFFIHKIPVSFINLPNKEYWLSENRIDETFQIFRRFMFWFGGITIGFLTVVLQEVYNTNIAGLNKISSNLWIYLALLLIITAFLIINLIAHFKRIDKPN